MKPSRRQFLRGMGAASLAGLLGCERLATLGLMPPAMESGPFMAPAGEKRDAVSHVIDRLSYGPRPGDYARVKAAGIDAYIEAQLDPDKLPDSLSQWRVRRLETLNQPPGELFEYKEDFLLGELSRARVLRAVYSERQLYEVMVEFWTDHFNIDWSKGDCRWLKAADDRDVIRKHALGRFPDLLKASALSPAMLWYLDGRANRKATAGERPNENYARELLELHTLGVDGGYTQDDVMEIARCLTGWTVRSEEKFFKGRVDFHPERHDDGAKVVLGRRIVPGGGKSDVDAVLSIAAHHPSTARFISRKLCRYFIGDNPPLDAVNAVEGAFQATRGDIRQTLRTLFATSAFRTPSACRLKRPLRFLVSALRATAAETDGGKGLLDYLVRMGHASFQYPTPDGYPQEPEPWLGTLLWRWHLAEALAQGRVPGTTVDWKRLESDFHGSEAVMAHLLARRPTNDELRAVADSGLGAGFLLAAPAFQRY